MKCDHPHMRPLCLATLFISLAACGTLDYSVPPRVPPQGADNCGAGDHAGLVGLDATALEQVLILGPVRVIRPGDAVTMDQRPGRINFVVSEAGRIERISCG